MRVPEISLGYGLLAQNKHDLCRYYKYTERHKQTQYLPAFTVSFMVVPSVRAWEFRIKASCVKIIVIKKMYWNSILGNVIQKSRIKRHFRHYINI